MKMKGKFIVRVSTLLLIMTLVISACGGGAPAPVGQTPKPGGQPATGQASQPTEAAKPAPVAAGETLAWKWNSYYASGDLLFEQDLYLTKKITALTGGRFTFTLYPSGQLTASTEVANSIASGAFPIGSSALPPNTRDFTVSSFAFYATAQDFQNWFFNAGGRQLSDKIHGEKFHTKFFPVNIISCDSGFRSNKPLASMADFKGMKIRTGTIEIQDIIKKWGGSSMFLSGNDIYQAAKLGTIDAFEFVGPPTDWTLGFQEVEKYWVYPAWYQTFTAYGIGVNIDAWNKLPKDFQEAIKTACEAGIIRMQGRTELQNAEYTQKFIEYGTKLSRISDEMFGQLKPVVKEEIELSASQNPNAAANYDSMFKYLKKVNVWKRTRRTLRSSSITAPSSAASAMNCSAS